MGTIVSEIDGTWAEGEVTIRPGESVDFVGSVTGVSIDGIEATLYADDKGTFQLQFAKTPGVTTDQTQKLILKHVEMALIDAGISVDPIYASPDYES